MKWEYFGTGLALVGIGATLILALPPPWWPKMPRALVNGGLFLAFALIVYGVAFTVMGIWPEVLRPRLLPILVMAAGVSIAVAGAAWFWWMQPSVDVPTLSDQEKFRRSMILERIREQYIAATKDVSPMVYAALENPPAGWTNQRLKEIGEIWQVQTFIRKSSDPGLFVECNFVLFPIRAPASGRMYGLNLYPLPLINHGGGLAEYSSQPSGEIKFGPEITQAHRCVISNYGSKPLINVTMGLYLVFQEQIKDANNPNASHSGKVLLERPWRIDIKKIDPGPGNQFEFYIWNMTSNFARVAFPESATAEYIGNPERIEVRVTSTNSYPLSVAPINEVQKAP
jgi:disulfide bond formation protein DsbB